MIIVEKKLQQISKNLEYVGKKKEYYKSEELSLRVLMNFLAEYK